MLFTFDFLPHRALTILQLVSPLFSAVELDLFRAVCIISASEAGSQGRQVDRFAGGLKRLAVAMEGGAWAKARPVCGVPMSYKP